MNRRGRTVLLITACAIAAFSALASACSGDNPAPPSPPAGTPVGNLGQLVAGECVQGIPPPDELRQVALVVVDCGGKNWDVRVLAVLGNGSDTCPAGTNQYEQFPGFAPAFVPKTLCLQRRTP